VNKHMIILPVLLITATSLLLFSLSLPDETAPPVLASASPAPGTEPSPESSVAGETPLPVGSPEASAAPTPAPTPEPTPEPSPTPNELDAFGIAATSPDAVLREAQIHAGRMDPFKSMYPPNLPEFETVISPEQLALPVLMPIPSEEDIPDLPSIRATPAPVQISAPPPQAPLEQGLTLKGIIDGGIDPIALIDINGVTELIRVGERLPGNILVTSIHYENKYVTLSRGQQKGRLDIPQPKTPSY